MPARNEAKNLLTLTRTWREGERAGFLSRWECGPATGTFEHVGVHKGQGIWAAERLPASRRRPLFLPPEWPVVLNRRLMSCAPDACFGRSAWSPAASSALTSGGRAGVRGSARSSRPGNKFPCTTRSTSRRQVTGRRGVVVVRQQFRRQDRRSSWKRPEHWHDVVSDLQNVFTKCHVRTLKCFTDEIRPF